MIVWFLIAGFVVPCDTGEMVRHWWNSVEDHGESDRRLDSCGLTIPAQAGRLATCRVVELSSLRDNINHIAQPKHAMYRSLEK
ncbi:uncharacterized protein BDZ83DRAFT_615581 [Colletotrichum acutatum]|uniref:Secreted protein n=1 Tax=Glomerella acutata TaxID=27357 RepID=A0AAD8UNF4_GLOAC|nr:uncharacterized protein BDZ83DRAFT_615581 [Colletotrichum acutatum]KAK1726588.1 hypothetical protein BDZ83DRAFT_615581 [Colletotrichum acutatum]